MKTFNDIKNETLNSIESYFSSKSYKVKTIEIDIFDIDKFMTELLKNTQIEFYNLSQDVIAIMRSEFQMQLEPSQLDSILSEASYRSSNLIKDSINTIHKNLKDLIQKIISENTELTKDELLQKLLKETKDKFSQVYNVSRADLIAQTTATFNTALTQKIVCKKLNKRYVWLSQRDSIVRKSHREIDGQFPDNLGIFHLAGGSGEHPGAISSAAESCHCRCYLFPQN